ncbi:phage holin family protein [Amycolatopsis suaedae]|uniref:Phage holin family protein n=1 Tax=Amycolatopsis suaedae TaxID=2510978 RepID=A0A4Q7J3M7_9PSEU|nr:phage holin family protein [Amycolatopsis suaedae]RZQ61589.1 phage holin family protein [Amycolatopsis suaedae]
MSSPKHRLNETDGMGAVPYLPLSEDTGRNGDQSIGSLVKDATQHMSTLVRAEVELAKSEITGEVKKALKGSVFFIVALVVALYSSFFLFFFLGELLSEWLFRWAAFAIVFGLMLLTAGLFGFLGYLKVKKIRAPQRTIDSVKETAAALKPQRDETPDTAPATRD